MKQSEVKKTQRNNRFNSSNQRVASSNLAGCTIIFNSLEASL